MLFRQRKVRTIFHTKFQTSAQKWWTRDEKGIVNLQKMDWGWDIRRGTQPTTLRAQRAKADDKVYFRTQHVRSAYLC
jgi:hypothetical protein